MLRWLPVNRAAVLLTLKATLHLLSHSDSKSNTRCHQRAAPASRRPPSRRDGYAACVCRPYIERTAQGIGSCPAVFLLVSDMGRIVRRRRNAETAILKETGDDCYESRGQ
ncbi:hypothetical protein EVAR_33886_1 [Eumeta japonica]|uniref:Secreted protein n=1 Tax=Eumeta variegata TaxID=151549 RepID=A0A4C1WLY3_EUMVA|nr:hypothetical protein EVAR_33886_1 [Eumeta japonica]